MRGYLLVVCAATTLFAQGPSLSRPKLFEILKTNKLLDPDRKLVHFSHTCNLRIDGKWYPVVDLQEIIPAAATARGDNRIVIFSPAWKPVKNFEYVLNRPLFCVDDKLIVYGDLSLEQGEGNVLRFSAAASRIELSHIEPQNYPLPDNKQRPRLTQ